MAVLKNKAAQPYIEVLYWFTIFSLLGFLMSFHKNYPPVDHEHMAMSHRISVSIFMGILFAFFIWLFNGLLRLILGKLFG